MLIPPDCTGMTEEYAIDKGGICGQACLAVIEGRLIRAVFDDWVKMGLQWRGWSGWKQLRTYLENKGYKVKQARWDSWIDRTGKIYLGRVQWLGSGDKKEKPFYGWGHWTEASSYTHFIVITQAEFFCNEAGIFPLDKLQNYLGDNGGIITSCLEITKK